MYSVPQKHNLAVRSFYLWSRFSNALFDEYRKDPRNYRDKPYESNAVKETREMVWAQVRRVDKADKAHTEENEAKRIADHLAKMEEIRAQQKSKG